MIEILAVIFGIAQSVLIMLNKRSNWIFYILQMIFLVIFSYNVHLYGNVILNIVYVMFGVVGYINWKRDEGENISVFKKNEILFYSILSILLLFIVGAYVFGMPGEFKTFDILTVWTSILATIAMVKHKIEAWILWFINDILYIITYFQLEDQPIYLIIMYIFWTIMSVLTFISWKKEYKKQEEKI